MNQSNENHLRETEEILRLFSETRNDDTLLMLWVWKRFHPAELKSLMLAGTDEELIEAFKSLPKEDSIKRYRRTLREKYPSSKEAEEKRRKEQEESKHFYAANGQGMMFKPDAPVTIINPPIYRGTYT